MHDALKAFDKDDSIREQLDDETKFVGVEHTTPGERSHMIYVNTKFTGKLKDLPMP